MIDDRDRQQQLAADAAWWPPNHTDQTTPGAPTSPRPAAPPLPSRRSHPTKPRRFGAGMGVLLLAVGALGGAGVARLVSRHHLLPVQSPADNRFGGGRVGGGSALGPAGGPGAGTGATTEAPGTDTSAIEKTVDPAVVDINVVIGYQQVQAAGTGMVLTADGEVLTNNHVIAGATRISVTAVGNGATYPAVVVGYDRGHDIAVLRLAGASSLPTVTVGDSTQVQVGAAVVAIGNAGGTSGTPTGAAGNVTALDQPVTATDASTGTSESLTGLIQTNTIIVPGDSGGPLVDAHGRVIGLDTAASATFRFRFAGGQGFAVPINQAMQIAHQIETGSPTGTVHVGPTAMLGVTVDTTSSGLDGQGIGAQITDVVSAGPAEQSGLAAGDVITSLAGQPITSADTLTTAVLGRQPGASVTVGYVRADGTPGSTTVTLSSGPPQ